MFSHCGCPAPASGPAPQPRPATPPQPKILRIGIIQGGRIVEERLVRERVSVTIGQSAKNMFVVPSDALPRSFVMFEVFPQGYALNFTPQMDGRISLGDAVLPLAPSDPLTVARARHRTAGVMLAAGMLGLDEAMGLRKPREEAPIVVEASDEPIDIDADGILHLHAEEAGTGHSLAASVERGIG